MKFKCKVLTFLLIAAFTIINPLTIFADKNQENAGPKINWVRGPAIADIDGLAKIKVPKGYIFAKGDDTRKLMKWYGNQETNTEVGYLAPESNEWFIVFEFEDIGYVKDDEKDTLDAGEIYKSLKKGNEAGNKWRKENNLPELILTGWYKKPHYNSKTNNLEWATTHKSEGKKGVNYKIRYLGRKGVMDAIIVGGNKNFKSVLTKSQNLLNTYKYQEGNKYTEFMEGDKIAKYGLTALITGGAATALVKMGFLKKFWKLIVAGIVGIGAFIKKFFSSIFRQEEKNESNYRQEIETEKEEE